MANPQQQQQQQQQKYRQAWPGEQFLYVAPRYGGVSNAFSGVLTNPADVLKVRLQMMHGGTASTRAGLLSTLQGIVRTEGPAALMAGWQASVMRELTYSTLRTGLYGEVKGLLASDGDNSFTFPLWKKILAGGASGCVGAAIANPTDLVKVRLQAQALNPATGRLLYNYPNPWTAIGVIFREEGGLRALYRGVLPTTQRAVILTATQFATYDEVKYLLLGRQLLPEGIAAHLVASISAGLAVATTTNPVDLVKSRYMNQPFDVVTGRGLKYSGVWDTLAKTVAAEGLLGLYKGWLPNWARIAPHTIISFLCWEGLRKAAGIAPV